MNTNISRAKIIKKTIIILSINYCYFLILFLTTYKANSQNYIRNPSFELFYKCPENYTQWTEKYALVPEWTFPTKGTSDYFNRCNKGMVGVPINYTGNSEAHDGNGYAGIILRGTNHNYREYIQTQILLTLKSNKRYCLKFYYKLASMCKVSTDRLGVYFTHSEIVEDVETAIFVKPQLLNSEGNFLDNKKEWKEFCGVVTGTGTEKYMIIGNFLSDEDTKLKKTDYLGMDTTYMIDYPYYYIDDVSLYPIEDCYKCTCDPQSIVDYETYVKKVSVKGGKDGEILVADITGGLPPYNITWSNGLGGRLLTHLQSGEYTLKITDGRGCTDSSVVSVPEPSNIDEVFSTVGLGVPVIMEYIYFEFDKAELLPESFEELNMLVKLMKNNPETVIEIRGHTDAKGTNYYNSDLSETRAGSVVDYLISHGINYKRVSYKGYGETMPIASNDTDQGRAKNRRVEFVITKR